jgi:hypothetical protein
MKPSDVCKAYAQRNDRRGYPWHVALADRLTGWLRRVGL